MPELLAGAAAISSQRRHELGEHLKDPKCPLFPDTKTKPKITPGAVDRLAEESEAGPDTLPVTKHLEASQKLKVPHSDDAIPFVKKAYKNKPKNGSASKYLEFGMQQDADQTAEDVGALIDYLASPEVPMMDAVEEMKEEEVVHALEEGGGLANTIKTCDDLNDEGASFQSIPELVDAIRQRRIDANEVKAQMKDLLNDRPDLVQGPLSNAFVDGLYNKGGAGLDSAALLNEVLSEGKDIPPGVDGLADAIKDLNRKKNKEKKQDKEKLRDYLADPACPLFTPEGNKSKEVGPGDVNKFYGLEKTGPGTGALLNALEESGKKVNSMPELLAAAKDLSNQRKDELLDKLLDPSNRVLANKDAPLSASDAKALAKDSTAGPATLELLKQLENSGIKVADPSDLAKPIKQLHDEKRKIPREQLPPNERIAGCGESPLDKRAAEHKEGASDADVEAMMNYLGDPERELLSDDATKEVPDVKELLEEGGGLPETIALCDYLEGDAKTFDSVPEITQNLPYARTRRAREKKEMKDILNDPESKLLGGGKPVSDDVIDKIHDKGGAGPHTTETLRELEAEGKSFPNADALAEAVKEKERARKQKRKKDKKALLDYLNSPNDLFSDAGNQVKDEAPMKPSEMNKLFNNEKSGDGTAALLDALREDNHKFDSVPELLAAAAAKSAEKRRQLADHLAQPQCKSFTDAKKAKPTPEQVNRLAEESQAGPATLVAVKSLEAQGKKFPNTDKMIAAVKAEHKKKKDFPKTQLTPPQREAGLGASPVKAALAGAEAQPDDTDKLKEYLQGPECDLFADGKQDPRDKDFKDSDLANLLDEGKGLENTVDLCKYLDEDGKKFNSLPELQAALKDALPKKRKVKDRMKKLLDGNKQDLLPNSGQPISDKDVEDLYNDANGGPKTAALLRELIDDGHQFQSLPELKEALKDAARKNKKKEKDDKAALKDYLQDPNSAAFSPAGNKAKDKDISPHAINDLYKNEKTGPGTVALLNALEEEGKKASSVPDLLQAGKDLSKKKRKELQDHLADPRCPAFKDTKGQDAKKNSSPDVVDILAQESEAGPATLVDLKAVEAAGHKVDNTEDLIPLVKAQHKKRKDLPKAALSPEERKAGDGLGSASKGVAAAQAKHDPDAERAALADYLKSPDNGLLDESVKDNLGPRELDAILAEADGVKDAIDQCEYLDHDGRRFPNANALADNLKDALPKRADVKDQLKDILNNPKKKKVLPGHHGPVTAGEVEKLYQEAEAGPKTAAHLRELQAEGKDAKSPEELANTVKEAEKAAKRKKRLEKQALKDYLNSPDCPAFTPDGNQTKAEVTPQDVNDLWKNEKSAPGTNALLDMLEAQNKKFNSTPELLAAAATLSGQKRKELKDHLSNPACKALGDAKEPTKPTYDEISRLAEESEAGPATVATVKEIEAQGKKGEKTDDLIPLVKEQFKKKPKGTASKVTEDQVAAAQEATLADVEALMDYLADPEITLINELEDMKHDDVQELLNQGGSLQETLGHLNDLNDEGATFQSIPELVEGIKQRKVKAEEVKQDMKELLDEPGNRLLMSSEPVDPADVNVMYEKGGAGNDSAAILRDLIAEGKQPNSDMDHIIDALKDGNREKQKEKKAAKEALKKYLEDPKCPLFTPKGNKEKTIGPTETNKFYGIEQTPGGTGALLNALEESKGKKYDSFPELLAGAKDLSKKRKKDLLDHLLDPNSPVVGDEKETDGGPKVTADDTNKLAKESTAGPATQELLQQLEAQGISAKDPEGLINAVKHLSKKKKEIPRSQLTPQEKVAGVGLTPLDKAIEEALAKQDDDQKGDADKPGISDADIEAMIDYLTNPECELLEEVNEISYDDVRDLLEAADGLEPAKQLCDYLNEDGKTFGGVPDITKALPLAEARRAREKKDIQALLTNPKNDRVLGEKPVTENLANKIHDEGQAGPKTTAHLRALAADGKKFDTSDDLIDAIKEAHHDYKEKRRKHKKAIKDYLDNPKCDIFSPTGNQAKDDTPITLKDINDLYRNEKSGPGTAQLLIELKAKDKKYDSMPQLLDYAKAVSKRKRRELQDHLADAKCPAFSEVKDKSKIKPTPESVARLAEESEAGPLTLSIVQEIEGTGKKFDNSDEMIPYVKKYSRNGLKGPLGDGFNWWDDQPPDTEALLDYLSNPNCVLLDDVKDIEDCDLRDLLYIGNGLDNTIDLCEYHNKDGTRYDSVGSLTANLGKARPKRRRVKERLKNIINEPTNLLQGGKPVEKPQIEEMYAQAKAGPKSASLPRALADDGKEFPNMGSVTDGVKVAFKHANKRELADKKKLMDYLKKPDCPAFTPQGNQDKDVIYGQVLDLYRFEQSGPGTIALLNATEEAGILAKDTPDLLAATKKIHDEKRKELTNHLGDSKSPIWSAPGAGVELIKDSDARDGQWLAAVLAEESTAGPATALHVRALEKQGKRFPDVESLIPAVKKLHDAKKDLPKNQLTKEERLYGLGQGWASEATKSNEAPKSPFECEALMEYLADPETELLDDDEELKMSDLENLLEEGKGDVKETIDLLEYLNVAGRRYTGVPDLTAHLNDAIPMRKEIKEQIKKVLNDKKKTPVTDHPAAVTDQEIDTLYYKGESGPRSASWVRDLGWDAKDSKDHLVPNLEALGEKLHAKGIEAKTKRKLEKLAIRDYLNGPDCVAWTKGPGERKFEITTGDVNALYRLENSGPGTITLLNSLENQKKKYDDFQGLYGGAKSTSAIKRHDLAKEIANPWIAIIPQPVKGATAQSPEIIRLAEESWAGPATSYYVRELAKGKHKADDSDELIPIIRKMHHTKQDSPFVGLSLEEGALGLGEGTAGKIINQKVKEKDAKTKEDVEALMEYLASEECLMMNECKELEPEQLEHLLNAGHSLKETLNLCKYLNFRCHHYDDVPSLTEAIKEVRVQAFAAKKSTRELMQSTMNHIVPGWGENVMAHEVEFVFDEANCGCLLPWYLRQQVDTKKEYTSKESLGEAIRDIHEEEKAKRLIDLENIRQWLMGKHGVTCALFTTPQQPSIRDVRNLFRIENDVYATAALLRAMQMGRKKFDSWANFLAGAKVFSQEKQVGILKGFQEKKDKIFNPPQPGKKLEVTAQAITILCEEGTAGCALSGYITGLEFGRKKYNSFEDLSLVVKRLHWPMRDLYWILKEGDPPAEVKQLAPVDVEHWNVDELKRYLSNPENKLVKNKKDINDKLLIWLLREGKGMQPTMRHVKHIDKLGGRFESLRGLTYAMRRAIRTQDEIKKMLTAPECKLLKQVDSKTPITELQIDPHVITFYETCQAAQFTLHFLEQLKKENKTFNTLEELTKVVNELREQAHEALLDVFGDAECVLLNNVDDITACNLNDLLEAGGSKDVAVDTLKAMNDGGRTYFTVYDLTAGVREKTGTQEITYGAGS